MVDKVKAVDCLILCPKPRIAAGQGGTESEKTEGRGGIFGLFPGVAERFARGMSHEELVAAMDEAGVENGMISIHDDEDEKWVTGIMEKYPGKFLARLRINPVQNGIMNEIRRVKSFMQEYGLQVITITGYYIGVPCTDKQLFPFYSLAIEHDIKVCIAVGYPGPAGLARTQSPLFVDEVCYLLPELKVIQTHLGHPWVEEAVHNVIKYPNCYLQTNEYRPKYFPPEFVHHLNTRAQDKILWASGHPTITFQKSLDDVAKLPIRDHVRPKYLRENALRLFKF
jgi:predicted TIM-barrel fold metal-dependent hydrolase